MSGQIDRAGFLARLEYVGHLLDAAVKLIDVAPIACPGSPERQRIFAEAEALALFAQAELSFLQSRRGAVYLG